MDAFQPLFDLQMHYIYNRRTRPPPAGQYGSALTAGAVLGTIPPPAPKAPPLLFSFLFFSSGSLAIRAGWIPPHPNAGRGLAVVYSPIKLVCDACGCGRLEWAGRIARLIAGVAG